MMTAIFIRRFFTALIMGCVLVVFFAQYDQQFKHEVQAALYTVLHEQLGCHISWDIREVGLFHPVIVFNSVMMSEQSPDTVSDWSWKAEQVAVHFSWLQLLMHGIIDLHVTLRGVSVTSTIKNGELPLFEHIKKFFVSDNPVPIAIKEIIFEKSDLRLHDLDAGMVSSTDFSGSMASLPDSFKLVMYSSNGATVVGAHSVVERCKATTTIEIPTIDVASSTVRLEGCAEVLPLLDTAQTVHFSGAYQHGRGMFTLSNNDGSCCIHSLQTHNTDDGIITDIDASISLEHITKHVPSFLSTFAGKALLKAHLVYKPEGLKVAADMNIQNAAYGNRTLGTWTITCTRDTSFWQGSVQVHDAGKQLYGANWDLDEQTKQGSITLANSSTVPLPFTRYWTITPHEGTIECTIDGLQHMHGSYRVRATNEKIESSVDSCARFDLDNGILSVDGALGTHSYKGIMDFYSPSLVQSYEYTDEHGNNLIKIAADKQYTQRLQGEVSYPLIKHLSLHLFDTQLGGQGVVRFVVDRNDAGFAGRLFMTDSTIRLLQTHNFIRDFQAKISVDYHNGSVQLHDFMIKLQKGQLHSKCCSFYFDDYWHLKFAHTPLFAHKLFLNVQKDMFVIFSGSLLGTYSAKDGAGVAGSIVLDRGQMKKNIFSSDAQKSLLNNVATTSPFPGSDCALDLRVESKVPLYIKTSALDAQITCNLAVKGTFGNPSPAGAIELVNGAISFPYRSLPIVFGKIYFSSPHPHDPAIELVARGKVKKYHITMRVDGTVSHPAITFESSPPLTEEQIVTVLLSGSDDGSLALAMPALVMHNVQSFLFGNAPASSTSQNSFIKNVLKPLKIIRIVPNFSDQQARGGIRGSLIIDLDDRFHALIQKNFSLPEDTRFEVEYHVSDDMTVRAIKDEHSDLGGEIEMRWKF